MLGGICMGWVIAAIVIWAIAPFLPMIIAFVAFLVKWIGIVICCIIDCFKR